MVVAQQPGNAGFALAKLQGARGGLSHGWCSGFSHENNQWLTYNHRAGGRRACDDRNFGRPAGESLRGLGVFHAIDLMTCERKQFGRASERAPVASLNVISKYKFIH